MHTPRVVVLVALSFSTLVVAAAQPVAAQTVGSANTAVADPPIARPATKPCTVPLFSGQTFADYSPKSFAYAPPAGCAGPWAKVVLTADFAVSAGRQFDRTANIWIGGANVYFGTTSEPSAKVARSWHVERDLTDYSALLATAQAGEVDLGNTVDATYTGIITGSATLELYPLARHERAPRTPDLVLPLSNSATGGTVALNTAADQLARSFTLPTNVEAAYLDVIAQSQSGDEFWYTCVPDDVAGTLQSCGGTGFRETEVTVDGQPAGVAPVYPWIFTGGIDPSLWAPTPGVQTLDFEPYRVDLSPFAGLLADGKPHTVALSVFNADGYFSTTASLLVYRDAGRARTSGAVTRNTLAAAPTPKTVEKLTTASDGSISGSVTVSSGRDFVIAGYVDTSHGRVRTEVAQKLTFANQQQFVIGATQYRQTITQTTRIAATTTVDGRVRVQTRSWPLSLDIDYVAAADGTATQATTVAQRDDDSRLETVGLLPVAFDERSNVVHTADTLVIDASGVITGTTGRASSQDYFRVDGNGDCYSRSLTSAAGLLTSVSDGKGCF